MMLGYFHKVVGVTDLTRLSGQKNAGLTLCFLLVPMRGKFTDTKREKE